MVKTEMNDTGNIQTKPMVKLIGKPQTQFLEKHNKTAKSW